MKTVFSFDFITRSSSRQSRRRTVFFFGKSGLVPDDCYLAIDGHYSANPISDEVIFMGLSGQERVLREALGTQRILSRIPGVRNGKAVSLPRLLIVGFDGGITELTGSGYGISNQADSELCRIIQHHGADCIFRSNNGMLESSDAHHYVKPSLKHTNRFIRSGSVLVTGVEIDFLAVWMLPMLSNAVKHIYTDSSTINSIAYALILLRNRMAPDPERVFPSIQSFESYKGLNDAIFSERENTMIIVSASSGGGMMKDLVSKYRIAADRICTLYYLGDSVPSGKVLCNLTRTNNNPNGYMPAIVTERGDRGPFPMESLPIHILAEAFVPENPVVEAVQVTRDDIPRWWRSFQRSFIGSSAVRCSAPSVSEPEMSRPSRQPVVIDVAKGLRRNVPFNAKMNQILLTAIPATVDTLIVFEDPASKAIAIRVRKMLRERGLRQRVRQIDAPLFTRRNGEGFDVKEGSRTSCCIICSTITDGTRLLDVAQILRDRQQNHGITFVIGLIASSSEKELREFKANISYSQSGVPYALNVVEAIELPRVFRGESTCWDDEFRFWNDRLSQVRGCAGSSRVKEIIEARLGQLVNPGGGIGLVNDVFLCRTQSPLILRPNSVFTEGLSQSLQFSQADVYLAATAVLHNMRTHQRGGRLEQHPHKRSVLSPTLFYRFSDGVIQAAFLRAARSSELDYRMDRSLSKLMCDVLLGIFHSAKNQRAEALQEVLYALASGKLRLLGEDLVAFVTHVGKSIVNLRGFALESYLYAFIRENLPKGYATES